MLCFTSPTRNRFASLPSRPTACRMASCAALMSWYSSTKINLNLRRQSSATAVVAEKKIEGKLLKVMKVQRCVVALQTRVLTREFLGQSEQRFHLAAHPLPIFGERVRVATRDQ